MVLGTCASEGGNNLVRDRNRKIALPSLAATKAEPLGLEMDANPVTKGAAGPREERRVSKTFGIQRWEGVQRCK